jgi:hypothetical protein
MNTPRFSVIHVSISGTHFFGHPLKEGHYMLQLARQPHAIVQAATGVAGC